jgi:hypothetical protein
MSAIEIAGVALAFQPTSANYSVTVKAIGNTRRTLSGRLDFHVIAEKREWEITVPEQGIMDALTPYLRTGTPIVYKDVDGTSYDVIVDEIPVSRYPIDIVGEVRLKLEEV